MRLVNRVVLTSFIEKHAEMRSSVVAWEKTVKEQSWGTPQDMIKKFPKASNVGSNEWWFNLSPGGYRLKAKIDFNAKVVIVKGIYTHDEYMKISKQRKSKK